MMTKYLPLPLFAVAFALSAPLYGEGAGAPDQAAAGQCTAGQDVVADELQEACKAYLQAHPEVKGGPGLSQQTAWIMPADVKSDAVRMEYDILDTVFHCRPRRQSLVETNGRYYDAQDITYKDKAGNGHDICVWFDITDYFAAFSAVDAADDGDDDTADAPDSASEPAPISDARKAELESYGKSVIEFLNTTGLILADVKDTASADAAAAKLKPLFDQIVTAVDALGEWDPEEWQYVKSQFPVGTELSDKIESVQQRLIENEYFGSKALQEFLESI